MSGEKTSKQKKLTGVIFKKINDVLGGRESTSSDDFLRGVQMFIANILSPWLRQSVTDICGNTGSKNHGIEMNGDENNNEFLVSESSRLQQIRGLEKTKDNKKKSKKNETDGQDNHVSTHLNIDTRRMTVVGRSKDGATAGELKQGAADTEKRADDIGKKYSKKTSRRINQNNGNISGKLKNTTKLTTDRELEKGMAIKQTDEENVFLEKVVNRRKIKPSTGTEHSTDSNHPTGKQLLKKSKIINEKVASKAREKSVVNKKRTDEVTPNKYGNTPKRIKITNRRKANDTNTINLNTDDPYQTRVRDKLEVSGSGVNVKIDTKLKIDANDRSTIVHRKYKASTEEVVEKSKTIRKNVKAVKTDDKAPSKKQKQKKNTKKNRNDRKSHVSKSWLDKQRVVTENENAPANDFLVENGGHDFSGGNVQRRSRPEEEWYSGDENGESGPGIELPEDWYSDENGSYSYIEEEWSQDDGQVTNLGGTHHSKTSDDETVKLFNNGESSPVAIIDGLDRGPEVDAGERDETTPRSREGDAGRMNTDGVGNTSDGPREDGYISRSSTGLRKADQVNEGGIDYISGGPRKDGYHSRQSTESRDVDQKYTADPGPDYTSSGQLKDDYPTREPRELQDVNQMNVGGAGHTSDELQADDYVSRHSRVSRDANQVYADRVSYISRGSSDDSYSSTNEVNDSSHYDYADDCRSVHEFIDEVVSSTKQNTKGNFRLKM